MTNLDFRKQLSELIKKKKISIAKLARAADLSYGTIFNFLKGKSKMTSTNLAKCFDILNGIENGIEQPE